MIYRGGRIVPIHGAYGAFWCEVWDRLGRFVGTVDRVSQAIALLDDSDRQMSLNFEVEGRPLRAVWHWPGRG